MPTQQPDTNPVSFTPGQLSHILQPLRADYQPRFTTSITTTNPEIAQQTEHDNVVASKYYDPEFDPTLFTMVAQTYSLKVPTSKSGQIIPILQKNDLSSKFKFKTVVENTKNLIIPTTIAESFKQNHEGYQIIDTEHRRILLREDIFPFTTTRNTPFQIDVDDSKEDLFQRLPQILQDVFHQINAQIVPQTITFTYQYFSAEEALTAVLPPGIIAPSSFTSTGHIAHFNLRPEHLPYQYVIGRIIADKTNGVKTVINKVGMINNVFRNFQAEVLYGESNFITELKENGFNFVLDFSQVYWNSRLLTEHNRVTQFIHKGWKSDYSNDGRPSYAIDLFGGIGPFVIPLAKAEGKLSPQHANFFYSPQNTAECFVWGNDINPKSSLYMYKNAMKNKILTSQKELRKLFYEASRQKQKNLTGNSDSAQTSRKDQPKQQKDNTQGQQKAQILPKKPSLKVFNSCGRELMQLIAKSQMLHILSTSALSTQTRPPPHSPSSPINSSSQEQTENRDSTPPFFQHALMNLPGSAVEFLDMFVGLYSDKPVKFTPEIEFALANIHNSTHTSSNNVNSTTITQTPSTPPTICYLTSTSTIPTSDIQELVSNITSIQSSILPPDFNDSYEELVENLDINDSRHHWSTIQAIQLTSPQQTHLNKKTIENSSQPTQSQNPTKNSPQPILSAKSTYSASNTLYIPSISTIKRSLNLNPTHAPSIPSIPTSIAPNSTQPSNELIVHCYCFVRDAIDPHGEALNLVEGYLGFQLAQNRPIFNKSSQNAQNYQQVPVSYNNQVVQLDFSAIPQTMLASSTMNDTPSAHPQAIDILTRQKSYLNSPEYLLYKEGEKIYVGREKYKDKYCSEEGLLLMNWCLKKDQLYIHHVRNVAPQKDMMCVSFVVPDYVLFYSPEYQRYLSTLAASQRGESTSEFINPDLELKSVFDSTPIDTFDIHLFNQQRYYHKQATYTTFLANKIQNDVANIDDKKKELTRPFQHSPPSEVVAHDGDDVLVTNDLKRQKI